MNKKDRILDLMRQGIISNEEAIELLENVDKKAAENKINTKEDMFRGFDPETFFVGSEFFERSDDVEDQKDEHKEEYKTDFEKKMEGDKGVDFADAMKNIVGWSNSVFENFRGKVDDNFEWNGGKFRLKTVKKSETKSISEDIRAINIYSTTGDVEVVKTTDPKARIDFEYEVFGIDEVEKFIEENVIVTEDAGILDINVKSKRLSADMVIYLPEKVYDSLTVNLTNGDLVISDASIDYIRTKLVNGDLEATNVLAAIAEYKNKNGEVRIIDGAYTDLKASTVNGDIKVSSDFETNDITTVNGSIRLAATEKARKINVKNVNGEIKMSVPENMGLTGLAKTAFGKYKTRLKLDNPVDTGKSGVAIVRNGDKVITFDLESKMGSIWLKDIEAE